MNVAQNVSLRPYNTFGMDVAAERFVILNDEAEIPAIAALSPVRHVVGGGSNILLTKPVEGMVILNRLKGIEVVQEDANHVWIKAAAGEVWHDLVQYAIGNNFGGIENLALIPGTVGASPIQNIGAYGVEVRETISMVYGWHWAEGHAVALTNEQCRFGYRDSIFKQELKDKILVTSVVFRLSKHPEFRTSYGAITQELEVMGLQPSVKNIANAVINIRRSKLPDPAIIGNAGSFFKNPAILKGLYETLHQQYPLLPSYPVDDDHVKVPAGWLIEHCGWKGIRIEDAGVHVKQALVLVNYGHAGGHEILQLSEDVIQSVKAAFGIELEREVQIW